MQFLKKCIAGKSFLQVCVNQHFIIDIDLFNIAGEQRHSAGIGIPVSLIPGIICGIPDRVTIDRILYIRSAGPDFKACFVESITDCKTSVSIPGDISRFCRFTVHCHGDAIRKTVFICVNSAECEGRGISFVVAGGRVRGGPADRNR